MSGDDYFAKNIEFATWLKEEKNVFYVSCLQNLSKLGIKESLNRIIMKSLKLRLAQPINGKSKSRFEERAIILIQSLYKPFVCLDLLETQ